MNTKAHAPTLALAALIIAGCGGGGSGGEAPVASAPPPASPPPPPTSATTAFTPFVKQQLAIADEAAEPASVNDQEWTFDEDEAAYDDVIAATGS
jgi:hypothetical protein